MELVVLGAGPSYSNLPGAVGAAYLLRHGDDALLLDLGHGAFSALAVELEPADLCAVVISHLHPDHFIDLVPLRHYLRYEFSPGRRVRVVGPRDLGDRLDALHAEPGWSAAALDLEATGGAAMRRIGPFAVESALVTHTDESYAYRVAVGDGPGLVYSGDCGRADDLVSLVRPGDTLLVECSFGPGPVPLGTQHLDAPEVARVAAATGPASVLLTHVLTAFDRSETLRTARAGWGGTTRLVAPGDRLSIAG